MRRELNHRPVDRSQIVFEQRSAKKVFGKIKLKFAVEQNLQLMGNWGIRLMSACLLMEFNLQIQIYINDVLTKTGAGLILNNCLCALK